MITRMPTFFNEPLQAFANGYSRCYHQGCISRNGESWMWGQNTSGELGNGTTTTESWYYDGGWVGNGPTKIVDGVLDRSTGETGPVYFKQLSSGAGHTIGVSTDGKAFAWGDNGCGQVFPTVLSESGPQESQSSPWVMVRRYFNEHEGSPRPGFYFESIKSVHAVEFGSYYLLSDGKIFYGGINEDWIRDVDFREVVWSHSFINIAAGGSPPSGYILGLKSNGEVWAWGKNTYGQLGDGTNDDRSSPTLISNHSFINVFISLNGSYGIKEDGTAWAWGRNVYGELMIGMDGDGPLQSTVPMPMIIEVGGSTHKQFGGVKTILLEEDASFILTRSGALFCGGNFEEELAYVPTLVDTGLIDGKRIRAIGTDINNIYAIDEYNRMWCRGHRIKSDGPWVEMNPNRF